MLRSTLVGARSIRPARTVNFRRPEPAMRESRSPPLLPAPAGVGRRIDAFWRRVAAWFEARLRPGASGRLDLASLGSLALAILLLPVAIALILTVLVVFAALAVVLLVLGLVAGVLNRVVRGGRSGFPSESGGSDGEGRVNVRVIRPDAGR